MGVAVTHIVGPVCKDLGRPGVIIGLMKAADVIKVLEQVCGQVSNGYLEVRGDSSMTVAKNDPRRWAFQTEVKTSW